MMNDILTWTRANPTRLGGDTQVMTVRCSPASASGRTKVPSLHSPWTCLGGIRVRVLHQPLGGAATQQLAQGWMGCSYTVNQQPLNPEGSGWGMFWELVAQGVRA